ncbi:40S ribosomal protein S5-1 [Hordeum vulgare]|nr:40S ribosomal protein S5-1 [Hordeum vulgare]
MKHPQTIEMGDGVIHIPDVQGPKKTGTMEARHEGAVQEIFRCQGVVEHGLSANYSMLGEFTHDLKVDSRPLEDIVFTLNYQINFLQGQVFNLQNQIFEYEARFKHMSLAASCKTVETRASSYNGEPLPLKSDDKFDATLVI